MAGSIFEQGGTFAEDLGVDIVEESTEAEDMEYGEDTEYTDEIDIPEDSPDFPDVSGSESGQQEIEEDLSAEGLEESVKYLTDIVSTLKESADVSHRSILLLINNVSELSKELKQLRAVSSKVYKQVDKILDDFEDKMSEVLSTYENYCEDADNIEECKVKKKGTPGRPAKKPTKIVVPKKQKKKKAVAKKVVKKTKVSKKKAKKRQ